MIKHIINFLALAGFAPFIITFYMLNGDGFTQAIITIIYAAILFTAIKLDNED